MRMHESIRRINEMENNFSMIILFIALFAFTSSAISQQAIGYNPREIFDPNFDNNGGNVYRSAIGAPGPQYWQNKSDYKIAATLDTTTRTITGKVKITYTNNSPDELHYVWLQLEQNRARRKLAWHVGRGKSIEEFHRWG